MRWNLQYRKAPGLRLRVQSMLAGERWPEKPYYPRKRSERSLLEGLHLMSLQADDKGQVLYEDHVANLDLALCALEGLARFQERQGVSLTDEWETEVEIYGAGPIRSDTSDILDAAALCYFLKEETFGAGSVFYWNLPVTWYGERLRESVVGVAEAVVRAGGERLCPIRPMSAPSEIVQFTYPCLAQAIAHQELR